MCKRSPVRILVSLFSALIAVNLYGAAFADSVNSPNISMNVDTNRNTGAGAGNISVTVNTITIAETQLPEYSAGTNKNISLTARPGFRFLAGISITAQSATIGIDGGAINAVATQVAAGTENETITFNFTSGTSATVQDIVRINGIKLLIGSAAGAAGPAQATITITTSSAGGAFTNQPIVASNIVKGAPDHLAFVAQPGTSLAGDVLLPSVKMVDFGGNLITNDSRTITLGIQNNPGSATLNGTVALATNNGVATWGASDGLAISTAGSAYTLVATHGGASFLSSDSTESNSFSITAGDPGGLQFVIQPSDASAGGDINVSVRVVDELGNTVTNSPTDITINSISESTTWPLLVDTSLTKTTENGVASWGAADHLRINKTVSAYSLIASGVGAPIESNTFNIIPGTASSLQFLVQPSNTRVEEVMSPAPAVEIVDVLGNRTSSGATVSMGYLGDSCAGTISGAEVVAADGVATFDQLSISTPCEEGELVASILNGSLIGISDPFDVKASDSVPVAVQSARLKRGKSFQFSAVGEFSISKRAKDDPTKRGAVLTVTGTTGSVRYVLPKSGWRAIGKRSFQFSGSKCESVLVTSQRVAATCNSRTGSFSLPEPGPVSIVLKVGRGTAEFCGECGGTSQGNESRVFRRTSCDAPTICP